MKRLFLVLALIGCGSDKDSSDEPITLQGLWAQETDCGYAIDIDETSYMIMHICYTYQNEYELSFKLVKFDNDDGVLSGVIVGSTCPNELGTDYALKHTIEGNSMTIGTDKVMIGNLIKYEPSEPSNDPIAMIYGCGQTGTFVPTQIYGEKK